MRCLKKSQTTVFHEWNIFPSQSRFQSHTVVRGSKQHCLLLQLHALLSTLQNLLNHMLTLRILICTRHETRDGTRTTRRPQFLVMPLRSLSNHPIGDVQYPLRTAVVLLQRYQLSSRIILRKIQNVAHCCSTKRINRLRIVSNGCQPDTVRTQVFQYLVS